MALYPKAGTTLQLWIYWSNGSFEGTKKSGDLTTGKLFMNILNYGADPWSILTMEMKWKHDVSRA